MNCYELMTGDFVRTKRDKEIIRIFEIDDYRNIVNNEPDGYCSERNIGIDKIEPIPLTAEILEKNGWYRDGIFMEKNADENTQLSWTDRCGAVLYKNSHAMIDCANVHTLQHALRLCGLNELTDNFKMKGCEE